VDYNDVITHLAQAHANCFWNASDIPLEDMVIKVTFDRSGKAIMAADLLPVRETALRKLFQERGFCILRVTDADAMGDEELIASSRRLAQAIGRLHRQNKAGDLVYRVEDLGEFGQDAFRFSKTNRDSTLHNDCVYRDIMPTIVALFCIRPAPCGGISQVSSVYRSLRKLGSGDRDTIGCLLKEYYYDRRGTNLEGEAPVGQYCPVTISDDQLFVRYLRPYIEFGQERMGAPLSETARRAFDRFDATNGEPEAVFGYSLQRGECLVVNNTWILHNRSEFQNLEGRPARLIIRYWLS
jgi:alpha-ketoglutarate-dependent taurine dioxygenase